MSDPNAVPPLKPLTESAAALPMSRPTYRSYLPLLPLILLLVGLALGFVHVIGLLIGLAFIGWTLYGEARLPWLLWWPLCALFSVALAIHILPGSEIWTLWPSRQLTPDAPAYALRISWDKLLAGYTLLVWWLRQQPAGAREDTSADAALLVSVMTLFAVPLLAMTCGLVVWKPKWPDGLWIWMLVNLTVIALTEEAFFRGLLQSSLVRRLGAPTGIGITSLLFGAVHLGFSPLFALVSVFAGLGYGLAFHFSRRLWVPIVLHAAVNTIHLLLWSYPLHLGA
ncbi:MAG: hypothetical protein GAK43_01243 [Stenotrophomonas maltophilia]|nr:MAG: hypothetical protein GAK43_01243 [Stenotrophomonas maltophilia]